MLTASVVMYDTPLLMTSFPGLEKPSAQVLILPLPSVVRPRKLLPICCVKVCNPSLRVNSAPGRLLVMFAFGGSGALTVKDAITRSGELTGGSPDAYCWYAS